MTLNQIFAISLAITASMLVSCKEVKTQDGRIPEAYLAKAKTLSGTYYGEFDGKKARVEIVFDQDRPRLVYKDSLGTDVIHPRCSSTILELYSIDLSKHRGTYQLDRAIFRFHPGTCTQIPGRILILDFSNTKKFTLLLNDRTEYYKDCTYGDGGYGSPYPGWYPGDTRRPLCRTNERKHYMRGDFFKISP
ncbi:MAG: hypothetical protein RJB66_185 [Pseudomonadota bacterium]|jgi:hypothetical protein